jgi:hypothetical protein
MSREHLLGKGGSQRSPFLIKLTYYEGTPLLDIRSWFTDKEGVLRATSKGVSLSPGRYSLVAETLERYAAAIEAWLGGETDVDELLRQGTEQSDTLAKARAHYAAVLSAADRARLASGTINVEEVDEPRSRFCFAVDHLGGEEQVILNRAHPFGRRVAEAESAEELRSLLFSLIATFSRARYSMSDEQDASLFDLLERDWAERLAAFARVQARTSEEK